MTVANSTSRASYSGNGVTTSFTVPFRFLDQTHLNVYLIDADGNSTLLALTTDYTVSGVGAASGSVTLVVAPAVGEGVVILRDVPFTQEKDYVTGDKFPAESHEEALDKLTMIVQQQAEELARTMKTPVADDGSGLAELSEALLTVAGISEEVQDVAGIKDDVTALAAIDQDVTAVAGIAPAVSAVAANETNIDAVAANETNINTVSGLEAEINDLAPRAADIETLAPRATDLATLAPRATDMQTLAPVAADIQTVADNIPQLSEKLPKDGSEPMTGPLILAGSPDMPLEAATKSYVDASVIVIRPETYGAKGDVRRRSTIVTINSGSTALTTAHFLFAATDVGKHIEVAGAGPGGAPLKTTIAAYVGPGAVTLADAASTTLSAVSGIRVLFGSDDTSAMQAAFNALGSFASTAGFSISPGLAIELRPGAVYGVTNITVPTPTNDWRRNRVFSDGTATLFRLPGGDSDYMVATGRWIPGDANASLSGSAYTWENVYFDANHECRFGVVNKTGGSEYLFCSFDNATEVGHLLTRQNQDGSLGTTTFLSGTVFFRCYGEGNGGWWLRTQGQSDDDSLAPTDGHVIECHPNDRDSDGAIYLANAGGWTVRGNHSHSHGGADPTIGDLQIGSMGNTGAISHNTFENKVRIGRCGHLRASVITDNNFWSDVQVDFGDDTTEEVIVFKGNIFSQNVSNVAAKLIHNNNRAVKTIVTDDVFVSDDPLAFGSGVTLGIFEVLNCVRGGLSDDHDAAKMSFNRAMTTLTIREVSDFYVRGSAGSRFLYVLSGSNGGYIGTSGTNVFIGTSQNIPVLLQQNGNAFLQKNSTGLGFLGATPIAQPAYGAPTGTATRTTFATGSVTLPQLAERVKALIDDLRGYGLLS